MLSYKQCQLLKAIGFDEYCKASYVGNEYVGYMAWKNSWKLFDTRHQMPEDAKPMLACPTIPQVLKWFRDVHNLCVEVEAPNVPDQKYTYRITTPYKFDAIHFKDHINSWDDAEEAGVDWCIDHLSKSIKS